MTNLPCDLIRDLLPLYLDGVCSEESKTVVEAHLEGCEACKAEYQQLLAAQQLVPAPEQTEEKKVKALRRVKRKLSKKRLTAVLLTTVAILGIAIGLLMLASSAFVILPYDETKLRIAAMSPENAKHAGIWDENRIEETVDLQVSGEITEYYSYLGGKYFTMEENGKTIHAAYYYLGSTFPDYLIHGGKGDFQEHRLRDGLEDSFYEGIMHWGLSTTWTETCGSLELSDFGTAEGQEITLAGPLVPEAAIGRTVTLDDPKGLDTPDGSKITLKAQESTYTLEKSVPLDRIYYLDGPHFGLKISDDQKAVEEYGVLLWEREP